MADQHRRRRPRAENFETPILKAVPGDSGGFPYEVHGNPPTFNHISSRLWEAVKHIYRVEFLRSKVDYNSDQDADEWKIWRYLGDGAFGSAALWIKRDNNGDIVDEIVMKEALDNDHSLDPYGRRKRRNWSGNEPNLSREAVLQSTVNKMGCQNIVHLRGYKVYILPDQSPRLRDRRIHRNHARHYFEYAPYGDLETLRIRYRAHNRYLPELFLWHLFNSLAQAAVVLERFQAGQIHDRDSVDNDYILHLDIKPSNIFLGYEELHNPVASTGGLEDAVYPSIKLGDFGLAVHTYPTDRSNPATILNVGTYGFEAPVRNERVGRDPDPSVSRKITSKSHVWNIGKVMFDLATLAQFDMYESLQAQTEETYHDNGDSPLPNYDRLPYQDDRLHHRSPYSEELTDLIRHCMQVPAHLRVTPRLLCEETHRVLQQCLAERESGYPASVRKHKLYYRGTEIRNMKKNEKNCEHTYDWALHGKLHNFRTVDPHDPPFKLGVKNIIRSDPRPPSIKVPDHANRHRVFKKRRSAALRTLQIWSNNHNVRLRNEAETILFGVNDPYADAGAVGLYPSDERFRRTSLDVSSNAMSDSSDEGGDTNHDKRAKWYNQFRDQDKRYHPRRGLQTPPTAQEQHENIYRAMHAVNGTPGDVSEAEAHYAWQRLTQQERDEYNEDYTERMDRYRTKREEWRKYYPIAVVNPPRPRIPVQERQPLFPNRVKHPAEPPDSPTNHKEYFGTQIADDDSRDSIHGMQYREREDRVDEEWDQLSRQEQQWVRDEWNLKRSRRIS